jgi:hypothetical protein
VLKPISRRNLIAVFKACGFTGPYSGKKHQFMSKGSLDVRIPNPHPGDIGVELLKRILEQAEISRDEWNEKI